MTDEMRGLIERIEGAKGRDRELDCRIWCEFGGGGGSAMFEACRVVVPDFNQWQALRYTASIDAAMTLVPEGWRFGIEQAGAYDGSPLDEAWCWPFESNFDPDWQNGQQGYRDASDGARGYAATPALALCAAALKALHGGED